MSVRRFLFLSFLLGAFSLAVANALVDLFIYRSQFSLPAMVLSSLAGGLFMTLRARWAARERPEGEDAHSWRRHDMIRQATVTGLALSFFALVIALGHVATRPGS